MSEPQEPPGPASPRETFLGTFLAVVSAVFFFVVLVLVSGGFFFYVALAPAVLLLLGGLHYLLWGRLLRQELSDEIAEVELLRRARDEQPAQEKSEFRR